MLEPEIKGPLENTVLPITEKDEIKLKLELETNIGLTT